jgi:hypothetical protein
MGLLNPWPADTSAISWMSKEELPLPLDESIPKRLRKALQAHHGSGLPENAFHRRRSHMCLPLACRFYTANTVWKEICMRILIRKPFGGSGLPDAKPGSLHAPSEAFRRYQLHQRLCVGERQK